MVQVKNISQLNIEEQNYFGFVGYHSAEITITALAPDGEFEYLDFEAYSHTQGTLIKFNKLPEFGYTPWSMKIIGSSGEEEPMQWVNYEDSFDIWENRETEPHSFLSFMKSQDMRATLNHRVVDVSRRCDSNMFGPAVGYFPQDGIKPTSMDLEVIKNYNAALFRPVVNVSGIAHITNINFRGIGMTWRNWPIVTLSAKTLSGCLRQVIEWRDLRVAGLSNDQIAIDALNFVEQLKITQEMIDELKQTEVRMPVERFMLGYGNPRHGFSETGILPESIKALFAKQVVYRTLSTLETKHPLHPQFSSEIKTTEKQRQQNYIIEFVSKVMPGTISVEQITVEDIYREVFRQRYKDEPNGRGPIHPVDMNITEKAVLAARFFDAQQ